MAGQVKLVGYIWPGLAGRLLIKAGGPTQKAMVRVLGCLEKLNPARTVGTLADGN